jgi:predicted DNA-binding transcriptional regulator AlpA
MEEDKMANQGSRLLKQEEVAELIGMSRAWLEQCRFRKTGIPYLKLGRAVRYRMKDVMEWLEAQAVPKAN